ncbi:hypothetical protein [Sporosarcina cyprini]|uniref:hypothetical protein n=1 Tax=Sporosarcina cyprini TaxID=2910523 RepID=UPI001EDE6BF8|nr:hypothetical protein [Sporosarcina cyprini]MCG3087964.1 hypothetical protein [Sporosarcina cyprini]
MFRNEINQEFMEFQEANNGDFTWWSYVNMKADVSTALGFAKFFYPDIIEVDRYFLLQDKFSPRNFELWKRECEHRKAEVEKMMNLYQVSDFFHLNRAEGENVDEQITALGQALQTFWSLSFANRFPGRAISVPLWKESDGELFISVFEEVQHSQE